MAVTYLALNKSQHAESLQEIVLTLSARSVRLLISFKMVVTYCDEEKDNGICSCQLNFARLSPMTIKYTSTLLCKARKDRRQKT